MKQEIDVEIVKEIGALSAANKGWTKQVNLVKWNGNDAKIDIRSWTEDHEKMTKGISLTEPEAQALVKLLDEYFLSKEG